MVCREELGSARFAGCDLIVVRRIPAFGVLLKYARASVLALALSIACVSVCGAAPAQEFASDAERKVAAQTGIRRGALGRCGANRARVARHSSADLDFIAGLALARLQRWNDARDAFGAGHDEST